MYPKKRQTAVDDLPTDNDGNPIFPEPSGHEKITKDTWEHHLHEAANQHKQDEAPEWFSRGMTHEDMDVAYDEHGPGATSKKK